MIFLFYVLVISFSFFIFRDIILKNSNVKKLNIESTFVVFIAAASIPETFIWLFTFFIKPSL